MKVLVSTDRHNTVTITSSGAFLYQTECNLENDIKYFYIINFNIHCNDYIHRISFYEYEVQGDCILVDLVERIYVM